MLAQLELLILVGWILLLVFITIAIAVISLGIGIKAVKGENTSFGRVFVTGLLAIFISGVITFIMQLVLPGYAFIGSLVGLLITMFIIIRRHETTFFGALGAILIYAIVLILIIVLLFFFAPTVISWISSILSYDITQLFPFL
ncbi:MAG: hypothetical protein ACTSVZ_00220 [Promethearchaeota archaeon]